MIMYDNSSSKFRTISDRVTGGDLLTLISIQVSHQPPLQNKTAKSLVSAYLDDGDKMGIEDDLDFYEDPKQKKKDGKASSKGTFLLLLYLKLVIIATDKLCLTSRFLL